MQEGLFLSGDSSADGIQSPCIRKLVVRRFRFARRRAHKDVIQRLLGLSTVPSHVEQVLLYDGLGVSAQRVVANLRSKQLGRAYIFQHHCDGGNNHKAIILLLRRALVSAGPHYTPG